MLNLEISYQSYNILKDFGFFRGFLEDYIFA
jgi:hypothetical protein